jgi:hypothetical protein
MAIWTLRVRCLVPPPQICEHDCHEAHSDTTQSMGQSCSEHAVDSANVGQAAPPAAPTSRIERERDFAPPPQDFEQSSQEFQAE